MICSARRTDVGWQSGQPSCPSLTASADKKGIQEMEKRPPKLQVDYLQAILRNFAGSSQPMAIFMMIALLGMFQWFCDSIYNPLVEWRNPRKMEWLIIVAFPVLLAWTWWKVRHARDFVLPLVMQGKIKAKAHALILFLSPCGKDDKCVIQRWPDDLSHDSPISERLKELTGSWRMPLQAVSSHMGENGLRQVAVICSGNESGTWKEYPEFEKLVHRLAGSEVVVFDASKELLNKNEGVDFEDAEALNDLVNRCFRYFYQKNYADDTILVDVTGGTKVATISGAIVALAEGRRFQYVSPNRNYEPIIYDITYR